MYGRNKPNISGNPMPINTPNSLNCFLEILLDIVNLTQTQFAILYLL